MKRPWLKFYPADWRSDPRLRMCSLAARGLWVDLISYMHEGEPYGHLTINGARPKLEQIASLVGRPSREVEKAFAELVSMGVCSCEGGAIISRRMVRDKAKEERDQENGKGGGNPHLVKADKGGVNPPDTPEDNGVDKAQKLEARGKILEEYEKPKPVSRSVRARPLPENWQPSEENREYARVKGDGGWAEPRITSEAERFRNHCFAKNRKLANIDAAWRNWVTSPYQANGKSNGHLGTGLEIRGSDAGNRARELAQLAREREAEAGLFRPADPLRGH